MSTSALADELDGRLEASRRRADEALEGLREAAASMEMQATADDFDAVRERVGSEEFGLMVLGRFNNGKSTLLNALLVGAADGLDTGEHLGPMPMGSLPTTAILTAVRYGERPTVRAWRHDRTYEDWDLDRFLADARLNPDLGPGEVDPAFADVRQFECEVPSRLCRSGVVLYDSPGLDEDPAREVITRTAMDTSDAAVIVFSSHAPLGHQELEDDARLSESHTPLFRVVNLFERRDLDRDGIAARAWNYLVADRTGAPRWTSEADLASQRIFLVDAYAALEGRREGDAARVRASGIEELERALGEFLVEDRFAAHMEKHAHSATTLCDEFTRRLAERRAAATIDRETALRNYETMLPAIEELRQRPARLAQEFAEQERLALADLGPSATALVEGIKRDLPGHMEAVELPSQERRLTVLLQRSLAQEATDEAKRFVLDRVRRWSEDDTGHLHRIIARMTDRLQDAVRREADDIDQQIREIKLALGWEPEARMGLSLGERALAVPIGILAGGPLGGALAAAGGAKAAAAGLGAGIATAVGLSLLSVTSATMLVFLPPLAAIIVITGLGMKTVVKQTKGRAVKQVEKGALELEARVIRNAEAELSALVDEWRSGVLEQVQRHIDDEIANIKASVRQSQLDQADKEAELKRLGAIEGSVVGWRAEIEASVAAARV